MFNLLFLSVTRFFLIITVEQNMHDKNKDTKSFTELRKYLLNGYFLIVLPRAVFRTQSKVYGGAFLQK